MLRLLKALIDQGMPSEHLIHGLARGEKCKEIARLPMPTTCPWTTAGACTHQVHAKGDVQGTFQRKVVTEVKKEVTSRSRFSRDCKKL